MKTLAISEGNSDGAADVVIQLGEKAEGFNQTEFRRGIGQIMASQQDQSLRRINVGKSLLEVSRDAADNGLFVPSELTLLGKTLLQRDEVGEILDPTFDESASIRRNVGKLVLQRMGKHATQGSFFNSLLEMKEFVGGLPSRLDRIMDAIINQELQVTVRSVDAHDTVGGILLASLILGASQLMRIQTSFQIFGYPGLAILCFLSTAGGVWLVMSIFVQDHRGRQK